MTFKDFEKSKNNFEFIKEFNRKNDYAPSLTIGSEKDTINVNKGFMYRMYDEEEKESDFSFLAENTDLTDDTDFSDPASLIRRQKKIIENIEKHRNKSTFDPLKIIRKPDGVKWMMILCHGGKFAL